MKKVENINGEGGPPKWAVRFFRWYCNDHLVEAVLGDMVELFQRRKKKIGKKKADILFLWNVLCFIQPFAIRRKSTQINNIAMLENYLKISWRTMTRQKMYAAIKVGGFAVGLATCILIFLFIRNEMDYDQQYIGKNVYRLYNDWRGPEPGKWLAFPANIHSILKNDYPEVEKSARLIPYKWFNAGSNLIRRDDREENTYEERFAYADNDLLDILDIPMVFGSRESALTKPMSIVLSKKMADKYFPHEDPVGKIIILNEEKSKPYMVGGVMKDFPANSHIHYDFFITLVNVEFWPGEQTSWCCWNYHAYMRLRPNTNIAAFQKKLTAIKQTYYLTHMEKQGDQSIADVKKYHFFGVQPVQDIYLNSDGIAEGEHGDMRYIWLFGGIACFILILACINFINLATARSANRAKEVGLRKVVGSFRGYLVRQFLTESLLYSFVSFGLALVIVVLSLPFFNQLAGKQLSLPWTQWWFLPSLTGVAFVVGILAGIYPAFYLSAFKPVDVLKGSLSRGTKSSTLRSAMVVFQFTTSIILIISTIVIYNQMNFILHTKIGFDKERIIMVQGANTLNKQHETFKNEVKQLAGVENVTANSYLPVEGTHRDQNGFWKEGREKLDKPVYGQSWWVDDDYISTLGMKLIAGRNFDEKLKSDTASIIVNQKMAKELGLSKPLGERIGNWRIYTVIGVVEDFHFESMKGEIRPLCMKLGKGGEIVSVKVKSGNISQVLASVQKVWSKFMPHQPFRYTFMDQSYARMYEDVDRTGKIFGSFAGLAIFVACLGLFALSAFMVEQRGKEISIRLVMGASVRNIFGLLTQNFVALVIVSFVLAAPLAWYLMNTWLQDYKYKIELSWDMFVLAGGVSLLIAVSTISYQTISAALASPADRLRSE